MRKLLFAVFINLIFLFGFSSQTYANIDGHLKVESPNGGESYKEGDTITIKWDASENIDKIMLGYSFGPGSLNWIATSIPNTGSYTWNVNVGNTTNTQVMISITGYETGKGSLSDKSDGYFTVQQSGGQPTPPPSSVPTSTPKSTPVETSTPTENNLPKPIVSQPIIVQNNWLSITTLEIWNIFIFDGSNTTDLTAIEDKTAVENFTLDTISGFEFIFLDTIDLTKQDNLLALQNIQEFWIIEEWFVWIKWEWFEEYSFESPIKIAYENESLTEFVPNVTLENKDGQIKEAEVKLEENESKIFVEISQGAKITVTPRVELQAEDQEITTNDSYTIKGYTSHSDLDLMVSLNGIEQKSEFNVNQDTGDFSKELNGLVKGANQVEVSYENADGEIIKVGEKYIIFEPNFFSLYGKYIINIIIAGIAASLGYIIGNHKKAKIIFIKKFKTLKKSLRNFTKKIR